MSTEDVRRVGQQDGILRYTRNHMDVNLIDGTYELFRHFYAVPAAQDVNGREIGAVRAVLRSVLSMIEHGATHIGVASDHVVESFRNDLYAGYKTSAGVPPALLSQFPVLEEALEAMGVMVWPMVEYEADDALASAAAKAARDDNVRQVIICTPDKDLGQCVRGTRVVQLDRRRGLLRDEAAVEAKFGVKPESIPDYLAVLGDSADGFPGIPGWGEKAAAATLLFNSWDDALLFRKLATLRLDVPVFESVDELRWKGPRPSFEEQCRVMGSPDLFGRAIEAATKLVVQTA